jgi:drug/metabolite transporter (DMT)-like permease
MNASTKLHWQAIGVLVLCAASQGLGFIIGKASLLAQVALVPGESSWFIAAQNLAPRFAVGVILLVAVYGFRVLQLGRTEWLQAGVMASCSIAGCMFQLDGMQFTTASVAAFITQFFVVLIPIWAALANRRWPRGPVYCSVLLVVLGLGLLAGVDWRTMQLGRGETEMIIAAVFFSVMLFSINWPGFAANRPDRTTAGMFLIETLIFVLIALWTQQGEDSFFVPWHEWSWSLLVLGAAIVGSIGPFILIVRWQRLVTPTEAGMIYCLGPVFTLGCGVFLPGMLSQWTGVDYPNETITASIIAGGLLILAANALTQLWPPRPMRSAGELSTNPNPAQ